MFDKWRMNHYNTKVYKLHKEENGTYTLLRVINRYESGKEANLNLAKLLTHKIKEEYLLKEFKRKVNEEGRFRNS